MNLIDMIVKPFQRLHADAPVLDWRDDRYYGSSVIDLRPTKTGKWLTYEDLLKNATVLKCVTIRAQSVAVCSRRIYKNETDEIKDTDPRQMLMKRPHPFLTKFDLDRFLEIQKLIYGTAFAQQVRDENFRVRYHYPLLSKNMSVAVDKDGLLIWKYRLANGQERIFAPWELHIRRNFSLDGVLGKSVFELAFESISVALGMEEYAGRVFENDSTPRGLLVHPGVLDAEAKKNIREEWQSKYGGLANRGKIGILDNQLEFKAIGMDNDVAQFLESRQFQNTEIANWFNVPQHMAGNLDRATNNNITQQSREFIRDTLGPDLCSVEEENERDLLWEKEQDILCVRYRIEDLQRGDFGELTESETKQIMNGIRSLNEIRKGKNLKAVEGGDVYYRPLALGIVGQPDPVQTPQNQPEKPPQNDPKKPENKKKQADLSDFAPIVEDYWKRIVNRESLALERELKKSPSKEAVQQWAAKYFEAEEKRFCETLAPLFAGIAGGDAATQSKRIKELFDYFEQYTYLSMRDTEPQELHQFLFSRKLPDMIEITMTYILEGKADEHSI